MKQLIREVRQRHRGPYLRYPVPGLSLFLLKRLATPCLISGSRRQTSAGVSSRSPDPSTYLVWTFSNHC